MLPRILVVPATSHVAPGVETVVVAGGVELLRRRSRCELFIAATHDPKLPDTHLVDHANIVDALTSCSLAAIVGRLAGPGLAHAAEIAFMARLLDVPVALIGVHVPADRTGEDAALVHALALVAAAATAADAESAHFLTACRGRRVEVVAPLELLARAPEASTATDGIVIGCDAALLHPAREGVLEALGTAVREADATLRFFGNMVLAPEGVVCERAADESVASVLAGVAGCSFVIAPGDSALHLLAASAGVPAIAWAAHANAGWHRRLGWTHLILNGELDATVLRQSFAVARAESSTRVAERVVPLRSVAWRALGSLADVRAGSWVPSGAFAPAVAAVVARACERIVAPALEAGDAARAEVMLTRWEAVLAPEPAWSCARARAYALNGCDAAAIAVLERALAVHADDAVCRVELARAWTRQGEFTRARAIWSELAADNLADAAPVAETAHLALLQGDATAALAAWAEALRRDPQHTSSIRAVRALLDAEPHREMEFWRGLCATHEKSAGFWQAQGLAAARALQWDAAERFLHRALELDPQAHAAREALTAALERRDPTVSPRVVTDDARNAPAPPVAGPSIGRL